MPLRLSNLPTLWALLLLTLSSPCLSSVRYEAVPALSRSSPSSLAETASHAAARGADEWRGAPWADAATVLETVQRHLEKGSSSQRSRSGKGRLTRPGVSPVDTVQWASRDFNVSALFAAAVPVVIRHLPVNDTVFMNLLRQKARQSVDRRLSSRERSDGWRVVDALAALREEPLEFFVGRESDRGGASGRTASLNGTDAGGDLGSGIGHAFASVYADFPLQKIRSLSERPNFQRRRQTLRGFLQHEQAQRLLPSATTGVHSPNASVLFVKATLDNFGLATIANVDFASDASAVSLFRELMGPVPTGLDSAFQSTAQPSARQMQLDADIWIGSAGAISHPHYDLQHNMYVQLDGKKSFFLAPMPILSAMADEQDGIFGSLDGADESCAEASSPLAGNEKDKHQTTQRASHPFKDLGWLFPATHGRHRQITQLLTQQHPRKFQQLHGVVLEAGDVLYIPPLYLHSGVSVSSVSTSLSVCAESQAEKVANALQQFPLPFEMDWSFGQRVEAVRLYTFLLVLQCLIDGVARTAGSSIEVASAAALVRRLVLARYSVIAEADVPDYRAQWAVVQGICANQLGDIDLRNPIQPSLPWLTADLWTKFLRRASEASSLIRHGMNSHIFDSDQQHSNITPIIGQEALLLADHIDVLTTFMVGVDAAYPVFALCYSTGTE